MRSIARTVFLLALLTEPSLVLGQAGPMRQTAPAPVNDNGVPAALRNIPGIVRMTQAGELDRSFAGIKNPDAIVMGHCFMTYFNTSSPSS